MKAIAKIWLLVAAAGLLLGCAAGVQAAAPDKYMPDNTELVLSVNVKALLDSGAVKNNAEKELSDLLGRAEAAGILKAINLDPRKDITSLTLCVGKIEIDVGGGRPDGKAEALALVRGKYDAEQIHKTLADALKSDPNKLAVSEYSGVKVYEGKGTGEQAGFFALLDNQTIAASNKKSAVTDAIDRGKGKSNGKPSKEMTAMLEKADSKRTIWVAMVLPGAVKDLAKLAPQGGDIIEKIEGLTAGASVSDDIKAEIKVHTTDEGVAAQVRQGVEAGKGLIAVQVLQNQDVGPLVQPIINSIKVAAEAGKTVTINFEVNAATIEKLAKKAKER